MTKMKFIPSEEAKEYTKKMNDEQKKIYEKNMLLLEFFCGLFLMIIISLMIFAIYKFFSGGNKIICVLGLIFLVPISKTLSEFFDFEEDD